MKITEPKVRKIKIEDILESHKLDPISVYLEDFEPRKGQIIIKCYDEVWSSFWGGMGSCTISEFFCSCDNGYLSGNLAPGLNSNIVDEDNLLKWVKSKIIERRRSGEIEAEEAKEIWYELEFTDEIKQWIESGCENSIKIIGPEWWNLDLPQAVNPKYEYLCRIIDTVKEVLKQLKPE